MNIEAIIFAEHINDAPAKMAKAETCEDQMPDTNDTTMQSVKAEV